MNRHVATAGWLPALSALGFCLGWILFWYRDTALAMVDIWQRSDTFMHAFLVPPISLWLIWRQRTALAGLRPRSAWPVVVPVALAGIAWLLGELAAVNAVTQLALVSVLVLAVSAVLGTQVAWAMIFPLGFLFYAVPVGEFVMPTFMTWTADFTVLALRLSGIPVYREGLHFIIPSGSWSVVEACSGIRYLIASLVIGTLYAYLNYRSLRRRLVFVAVSAVVPIVANWLRAYIIVMLGHLSGNKLAAGVDHLIYGWVFFGIVILVTFMIGARWSEHPRPEECVGAVQSPEGTPASRSFWLTAVLVGVATVAPRVWFAAIQAAEADRAAAPAVLALASHAGWQLAGDRVMNWQPAFAEPVAKLQSEFVREDRRLGIFVGYYRQQTYERKLVSSGNVLVRSKDTAWAQVASGSRSLLAGDQTVMARTAELRSSGDQRLVAWQWYWINGRLTTNDYLAKGYQALSRFLGAGDDSAVVILYAPKEGGESILEAFVAAGGVATIHRELERIRQGRG